LVITSTKIGLALFLPSFLWLGNFSLNYSLSFLFSTLSLFGRREQSLQIWTVLPLVVTGTTHVTTTT